MRPFWSHASCFMSYPVRCPRIKINHNIIVETMDDYVESQFIRSLVNFEPPLRCDSPFLCLCERLGRSVSAKLSLNSQWTNTSSSRFKTQRDTAICYQASQMNQTLNASKAMNLRGCVLGSGVVSNAQRKTWANPWVTSSFMSFGENENMYGFI